MKTMRERWICPDMDVQVFTPQEFVAACEIEIYKEYTVDPNGLTRGIHVKYDKGQDKVYTDVDHNGDVFNSNTVHEGGSLYYVGLGWGVNQNGQISWPSPTKTEAEMKALGIDMFYLFSNHKGEPTSATGGIKVYGGSEIEKILHNHS